MNSRAASLALPNTDQDVAATWDKLMVENAAAKLLAQTGTNKAGEKAATH
jgi:hypothetical protein